MKYQHHVRHEVFSGGYRCQQSGCSVPPTKQAKTIHNVANGAHKLLSSVIPRSEESVQPICLCTRIPRRGWCLSDVINEPVGVFAFKTPAGDIRYHCLINADVDPVQHKRSDRCQATHQQWLGCFATKKEAALHWDMSVRQQCTVDHECIDILVVNYPTVGCANASDRLKLKEVSAIVFLQAEIQYWQRSGFPYTPVDHDFRLEQLRRAIEAARDNNVDGSGGVENLGNLLQRLFRDDFTVVQQDPHDCAEGNQLCWSFQPHAFAVRKIKLPSGNRFGHIALLSVQGAQARPSAEDTFTDKLQCAKCVRSCVEYRGVTCYLNNNGAHLPRHIFAGELRFMQGNWVVNFQPLVAAALYRRYAEQSEGIVVYDSSAGWGGRMLGAYLSGVVSTYIACEPCSATFSGLQKMAAFLQSTNMHTRENFSTHLHKSGSEDFQPTPASVDIALTSPPYFALELYSDEATQAHIRFPLWPDWCEHFLKPTLSNTLVALKSRGVMLINIANNKMFIDRGVNLEQAVIDCVKELNELKGSDYSSFSAELETVLTMRKPMWESTSGARAIGEPVFVFRKKFSGDSEV